MNNRIMIFLLGTVILILVADNIRLRYYNVRSKRTAIQALIDKEIISNVFQEKIGSHVVDEERDSYESLIKFLGETRDLSFEFIEKCQQTVAEFVAIMEPDCKYYEKYGQAFNPQMPNDKTVEKLALNLPKLKDLLPSETSQNLDGDSI